MAAWEDMIDEVREYPTPSQDLRHIYSLSVTSDSTGNTLNLHGCSESQKSCAVSKCQDQRMTPLAEGPVRNVALLAPGADVDTARPIDRGDGAGKHCKNRAEVDLSTATTTSSPPVLIPARHSKVPSKLSGSLIWPHSYFATQPPATD